MGEGGYIRIQNKSKHTIEIKVAGGKRGVDDVGIDIIQGPIEPGSQLPPIGEGETPFEDGNGGTYQYIEGDVKFFFQRDGHFHLEAHVEGSSPSGLKLLVDHNNWWSEDDSPDTDSLVKMVADVDEIEENGRSKIEIRVYDNYDAKCWMNDLSESIKDTPFCQIGLPGTHDSGTYKFNEEMGASPDSDLTIAIQENLDKGAVLGKLNDFILRNVFERLCQCQEQSFQQQLHNGIRYLDLRIALHADTQTYWTCHGVYCVEMREAMEEINTFLNDNPKEVVILDFNHLYAMDESHHKDFIDSIVLEILGDKVADKNVVSPKSPVSKYWDNSFQAVVLYNNRDIIDDYDGKIWHPNYIRSPWPNSGCTNELHGKLKDNLESHNQSLFFVLQGILTPDTELIKTEIWETGGLSIKSMSARCNSKVVDWVSDEFIATTCQDRGHCSLNIVIVDFCENCSLITSVINYNRK